ncbi:hypothetical protein EP7_004277 [Isosphaeraceae bacterium EP7]
MATPYKRGRTFEYRVSARLVGLDYHVVRSASSHGEADLVASRAGKTLFVQAKTQDRLDPGEWNALFNAAKKAGALPILVTKDKKRKLVFWRLTGPKVPRSRHKPRELFEP